jgi:hypothetical protein
VLIVVGGVALAVFGPRANAAFYRRRLSADGLVDALATLRPAEGSLTMAPGLSRLRQQTVFVGRARVDRERLIWEPRKRAARHGLLTIAVPWAEVTEAAVVRFPGLGRQTALAIKNNESKTGTFYLSGVSESEVLLALQTIGVRVVAQA